MCVCGTAACFKRRSAETRARNMERTSPRLTTTGQKVDGKVLPLISSTRESSFAALPYAHSLASALYVLAQVLM